MNEASVLNLHKKINLYTILKSNRQQLQKTNCKPSAGLEPMVLAVVQHSNQLKYRFQFLCMTAIYRVELHKNAFGVNRLETKHV